MSLEKVRKQIEKKPVKLSRFEKFNNPKKRKYGKNVRKCRKCNRSGAIIRSYGLLYCRQCFREQAEKIGFTKYS